MITATALAEFGTLQSGVLSDTDVTASAVVGHVETGFLPLALSGFPSAVAGVRIRARAQASTDNPALIWSADSLRWRVGASGTIASDTVVPAIPKDGALGWVAVEPIIYTDPDGNAWTPATLAALRLEARVSWASTSGSVSLLLAQSELVVYVEAEASVHAVAVGDRDPLEEWVGDWMHTVAVGDREPITRWVGEEA